ncbi:hypothetical protein D3C75_953190 [compost metagenome]
MQLQDLLRDRQPQPGAPISRPGRIPAHKGIKNHILQFIGYSAPVILNSNPHILSQFLQSDQYHRTPGVMLDCVGQQVGYGSAHKARVIIRHNLTRRDVQFHDHSFVLHGIVIIGGNFSQQFSQVPLLNRYRIIRTLQLGQSEQIINQRSDHGCFVIDELQVPFLLLLTIHQTHLQCLGITLNRRNRCF